MSLAPESPQPPIPGEVLLQWRRQQLQQGGRAVDLDWLLDQAGGLAWSDLQGLRLHPERPVVLRRSLADLAALWGRHRRTAEPLQYLVGHCPWRDLELAVAPGVLIPRQETELLVERALALAPPPAGVGLWADLGTGSGCLALALARAWPASRGLAVDLSAEALAVAQRNWRSGGVQERIEGLAGSWWEPLRPWWGQLELVLANPPYIPSAVVEQLEPVVREHEPRLALDGGPDGLTALRILAAGAPAALAPGGWLLLEHHHDQSAAVLDLLRGAGLVAVASFPDLEGHRRFAEARRPPAAPTTR
ncbi:MAG: peptide chain release factor N(5)-glutamine methyltransferase [Synechococcus sp.]|nr:peptide chain release factor N(5)-glutamine methyltransferase [Synechococcus sp.]